MTICISSAIKKHWIDRSTASNAIRDSRFAIRDSGFGIRDSGFGIRDSGFSTAVNGTLTAVGNSDADKDHFQIKLYRRSDQNIFRLEADAIIRSLASPDHNTNPTLSEDGLTIIFTSFRSGKQRLWEARRKNIDAAFDPPIDLEIENEKNHTEKTPSLSADGKLLLYSMAIGSAEQIFYSVRETLDKPFSPPVRLDAINHPEASDNCACISPDGQFIYFLSRRNSPRGKIRLYVSKRIDSEETGE